MFRLVKSRNVSKPPVIKAPLSFRRSDAGTTEKSHFVSIERFLVPRLSSGSLGMTCYTVHRSLRYVFVPLVTKTVSHLSSRVKVTECPELASGCIEVPVLLPLFPPANRTYLPTRQSTFNFPPSIFH